MSIIDETNWKQCTGENISVAVIDTGLKRDHKDFWNLTFESYKYDSETGTVVISSQEDTDNYGHGTACIWIIHRKAERCKIISVRALSDNGIGSAESILTSLGWCIEKNINIINLSLGTYDNSFINKFLELGEKAKRKGILIFASAGLQENLFSIPARLENYICVDSGNGLGQYEFFLDKSSKKIFAKGGRQRVGWIGPDYIYLSGNSFATAHMSANAVLIKQKYDISSIEDMHRYIEANAVKENTYSNSIYKNDENINVISAHNAKHFDITRALIISLTKESHHLFRFKDQLNFQIYHVVDLNKASKLDNNLNNDVGLTQKNIINKWENVENIIDKYDTVIISRTHSISEIRNHNILTDILKLSIDHCKNIYSLEYLDYTMYPVLFEEAFKKNIKIRHPMIFREDLAESIRYKEIYGHIGTQTPVVGVFGTGTQQGKFTVQMMLRICLRNLGYKVLNLGTEIQSELFGFESMYPMEINSSIKFDQWNIIEYLQGQMRKLELQNPDIIIVGSQSGVIPHSYAIPSTNYTLPSIAFLMGTLPHAYILTINPDDDRKYIWESIHTLEYIGKGKVVLLVFSDCPRRIIQRSFVTINVKLSQNEIETIEKDLESEFSIPATEVMSEKGKKKLVNIILNYFS